VNGHLDKWLDEPLSVDRSFHVTQPADTLLLDETSLVKFAIELKSVIS
jgi:hypothetical protein